ncbi:hypothetical protein Sjap_017432 [Stephania japonica]|uniref:O-methyltransferase C-terminal domain-containing protein n=1 Tax=Stephania japonica TaxID=461633 RepID=A0AAP0NIA2_9MAGN
MAPPLACLSRPSHGSGINFDAPHVVSVAPERNDVEHIGGDMFKAVPQAHAAFLLLAFLYIMQWVLQDWCDDGSIEILKKCREAIPKDKVKVIIVDAVIEEANDEQEKEQGDYNYKLKGGHGDDGTYQQREREDPRGMAICS